MCSLPFVSRLASQENVEPPKVDQCPVCETPLYEVLTQDGHENSPYQTLTTGSAVDSNAIRGPPADGALYINRTMLKPEQGNDEAQGSQHGSLEGLVPTPADSGSICCQPAETTPQPPAGDSQHSRLSSRPHSSNLDQQIGFENDFEGDELDQFVDAPTDDSQ